MKTTTIHQVKSGTKKSFWQAVSNFYGRALPLSFLEIKCTTVREAKFITGVLFVALGVLFAPFFAPAALILFSVISQEGGHK